MSNNTDLLRALIAKWREEDARIPAPAQVRVRRTSELEAALASAPPSATVGEVCIRLNGIGEGGPYPVVNGVCVLPQSVAENLVASTVGQQMKRELLAQWASHKQPAAPSGEAWSHYAGSVLTSGADNEASVSFAFSSRDEAERFHEAAVAMLDRGVDEDAAEALRFLLTRIGSWTNARWDQHLRYEFGDERAERMITTLAASTGVGHPA